MAKSKLIQGFWQTLPKPFFILAPMEDVTDVVFRKVITHCGKPDVFFTEFTSVDGLVSAGHDKVAHRLLKNETDQPIVAQIWGTNPDHFQKAATMVAEIGFVGIDINMGCPVKDITKQGACSALINNMSLAKEIILATIAGAKGLPVSVKTRLGTNKIETDAWIPELLSTPIVALTLHGRTAKEMSKVPCHWDEIGKAVKIRNEMGSDCLIIGNGDIKSREEGVAKAEQYGLDGIMIGRGVFENPWVFNAEQADHSIQEKLDLLLYHTNLFEQTWGKGKNFMILRRFFKIYCNGFPGAAELRVQLMETKDSKDVEQIILTFLSSLR